MSEKCCDRCARRAERRRDNGLVLAAILSIVANAIGVEGVVYEVGGFKVVHSQAVAGFVAAAVAGAVAAVFALVLFVKASERSR